MIAGARMYDPVIGRWGVSSSRENEKAFPNRNFTGYYSGEITLYNHIIFTDNFDT